jgi:hypothetical protein
VSAKLQRLLLESRPSADWIKGSAAAIEAALLKQSRHVRGRNFTSIHTSDLAFLFEAYDRGHFDGTVQDGLNGRKLTFRLAPRMSSNAGKTTEFLLHSTGEIKYEIAIASSMLFDCFQADDHRVVTVNGFECTTRIEALMRIFEHEMVHLAERICWRSSNCSADRFQGIAQRLFGHQAHRHSLITRKERVAQAGIRIGTKVQFPFEGQIKVGVLNKVTKRATVLVEDVTGLRYSDGKRYLKFYVPIPSLRRAE